MSASMVRFYLPERVYNKGRSATLSLLYRIMGLHLTHNDLVSGCTIECTTHQFAIFLIQRNEEIRVHNIQGCNTFAELQPMVIEDELCKKVHKSIQDWRIR